MPRQPCSRWRTDCTSMRQRLEPRPPLHYRSPVRAPGYGTSTSPVDHTARVRPVHSKYRHPAVHYRLCSEHYRNSTQYIVRTATPNSCSLPHLTTGLEHLQHRSTPDSTWAEPCLPWCWQAGRPLSVLRPQPSPDPPDPGLPIAVRLLVPSSRRRFESLLARWCRTVWTVRHRSAQHNMARQARPGQASTWQIMME